MMKIGMLGCGTVGSGVLETVSRRSDMAIKGILTRGPHPELGKLSVREPEAILDDPEIDTVVEVMGGTEPALDYVRRALANGKNVVTANKQMIAEAYAELVSSAEENAVALRCTAAVGGGIPWLVNLSRVAEMYQVMSLSGIMNGTTNFILDAMTSGGRDFVDALAEAQRLGYAEADPSADVDGLDALRKCVISANIAFGGVFSEKDALAEGIRYIMPEDIKTAGEHGMTCRLIAEGIRTASGAALFVQPEFLPAGRIEASVRKNFNLISLESVETGTMSFYGQGAGKYPTAANVVADLIAVRDGAKGFYTKSLKALPVENGSETMRWYFRTDEEAGMPAEAVAEKWGAGVLTGPLCVSEAHALAKELRKSGSNVFFAGVRG